MVLICISLVTSGGEHLYHGLVKAFPCLILWKTLRSSAHPFFLKKCLFIYFQRVGNGGKKRGRETSVSHLLHALNWGLGLQLGHVPGPTGT